MLLKQVEEELSCQNGDGGQSQQDVGGDVEGLIIGARLAGVVEDNAKVGEVLTETYCLGGRAVL